MRRNVLARTAAVLALFAVVVLATRPLFLSPFFRSDDGLLHLLRVFALDRAIQQGLVYPRWIWDLGFGLGYPIFNYYPPLSAYLIETLHLLGLDFVLAFKAAFVVIITVGVLGAYAMGAELASEESEARLVGVLTAVAYVCFPYFIIDIYLRGAVAETLAAALLPWVVWSLQRVMTRRAISAVILAALFAALVLLAHSLTLFIAAPVLLGYSALGLLRTRATDRRTVLARLGLAGVLSVGASAFYWLPFVAELPLVRIGRGSVPIGDALAYNFVKAADAIQTSWVYEYSRAPYALGLVPVLLGIISLFATLFFQKQVRPRVTILFFGGVALLASLALIDATKTIWLTFPFATMVQYPWRVSILIGLGLAIVIGSLGTIPSLLGFSQRLVRLVQIGVMVLVAGAMVFTAFSGLAPQESYLPADAPTLGQLTRFEAYTKFMGTNTWGEYAPTTFRVLDLAKYQAAPIKVQTPSIDVIRFDAARRELVVTASEPVSISLRALYFPDAQITIDGAPTVAYPSTQMGLVTTNVAAGQHRVVFSTGGTLARTGGTMLLAISGVLVIVLMLIAFRRREKNLWQALIVVSAGVGVFALPTLVALAAQPLPLQSVYAPVTRQLELSGLQIDGAQLQSDVWRVSDRPKSLGLTAIWHVKETPTENNIAWRLIDDAGKVWASREQSPRFGSGYIANWVPNELVEDLYELPLAEIPPGRLRLQVAIGGSSDYAAVSTVELVQGSAAAVPDPPIPNRLDARVGDQIKLLGYATFQTLRPGASFPVMLYWQATQNVKADYVAFVQLLDHQRNAVAKFDSVPGGELASTFLWVPEKTVTDRVDLHLPRDLKPGLYSLIAGMYQYNDPSLTRLPVTTATGESAPDDVVELGEYRMPMNTQSARPENALDMSLGPAIRLYGYDLGVARGRMNLKLFWQALAPVSADYKVFVHVIDTNGNLVAQIDRLPADGAYPTRIWQADEKIVDEYILPLADVPVGRYTLIVGMYASDSGERLRVINANGTESPNGQIDLKTIEWKP